MTCRLCTEKLSPANYSKLGRACASCHRHYTQMRSGFKGVRPEPKDDTELWDNSAAYDEWVLSLGSDSGSEQVALPTKEEYTKQRCDIRDMRGEVGLPKFAPLESQVYTAWVEEGVKDEKMQEVLGLTYRQLQHVKSVVRTKLRKQMAYFKTIKKLEADATDLKQRKGIHG